MKNSLQELLSFVPLYQLKFLTPMPQKSIYYETTLETVPDKWLKTPTLLTLHHENEWLKLNDIEKTMPLIQDPNLVGLVICSQNSSPIQEEALTFFSECQFPVIQVEDASSLLLFQSEKKPLLSFSQFSMELNGFMEKGFTNVAAELAKSFNTPFLYLDEHLQLLWQTGLESEIERAVHWLQENLHKLNSNGRNRYFPETSHSFDLYTINIAGVIQQTLLVSADLVNWQKKLIDKLAGLTALLLQTEELFLEQQQKMKEHFVYDLLYHKFESKKVMVKQGKSWGWNLERPHHLLIINVEVPEQLTTNAGWIEEIAQFLENITSQAEEKLIVFPFQDQLVILLEDGEEGTISDRKKYVLKSANRIEGTLTSHLPNYHFYIGIGKMYQDTIYLNKSYQEAKLAVQFGQIWFENKNIFHISDLGILRLLIHIHQEILYDFSQEYLSPLLENDQEIGTEYIKTLKTYIQFQGIINEVSEALFIHPNTLRNRIKKIEEITGVNLQDPEEFMNLAVAVKIQSFMDL